MLLGAGNEGNNDLTSTASAPTYVPIEITDLGNNKRWYPNGREPYEFETEGFIGRCLLKVKTNPEDPHFEPYFKGKKRLFEIQIQGQFKTPVKDEAYIGLELGGRLSLGFLVLQIFLEVKCCALH